MRKVEISNYRPLDQLRPIWAKREVVKGQLGHFEPLFCPTAFKAESDDLNVKRGEMSNWRPIWTIGGHSGPPKLPEIQPGHCEALYPLNVTQNSESDDPN